MSEYYFELPSFNMLNIKQQSALLETNSMRVYGGAGTGKSVIAVYRHLANINSGKSSALVTYTTALAHYLKKTCGNASNLSSTDAQRAAKCVDSTYNWVCNQRGISTFDEIIVDEAQDVTIDNYRVIKRKCNRIFYSADENQCLYNKDKDRNGRPIIIEQLESLFNDAREQKLDENYRNTKEILRMARALLPNAYISNSVIGKARSGDKPVFIRCYKSEMVNTIKHIITRTKMGTTMSTHNIAILSPFQSNVNDLYDGLKDEFNEASIHSSNHGRCEYISNIHFTTFKSAKGLEFDTVIVTGLELINSLEKWRVLDWEDFYVAITRSKGKLFILGSSPISSISNYVD